MSGKQGCLLFGGENGAGVLESESFGRLDSKRINGSEHVKRGSHRTLQIRRKRCKAAWCPRCARSYWSAVKSRVLPFLPLFKETRLLTLTVDRKRFESGKAAYDYVNGGADGNGFLRRLLRLSGFKKAMSVLAFHDDSEEEPDGHNWPHWHILVDIADCGPWVNLEKMWSLYRDKWGIGGFDLKLKRSARHSSEGAFRYALNYAQSQRSGAADWVLDGKTSPRAFELYGELRVAVREHEKKGVPAADDESDDPFPEDGKKKKRVFTVRGRMDGCSESCIVLERVETPFDVTWKWVGELPFRIELVAFAFLGGHADVSPVRYQDAWEDVTVDAVVGYSCDVKKDDAKGTFDKLRFDLGNYAFKVGYATRRELEFGSFGDEVPF